MDLNGGIKTISGALGAIPWEIWHPPLEEFLRRPAFKDIGDIPVRYSSGAFITLQAMAGLNDYRTRGKAEFGYWPPFWKQVRASHTPSTPRELSEILEPFYLQENAQKQKVKRLHCFLNSQLAQNLWDTSPRRVAKDLPKLWKQIARTMYPNRSNLDRICSKKTIAFAPRTIGTALRILGVDKFNYESIPIPVDSRIGKLTGIPKLKGRKNLTSNQQRQVIKYWDDVLLKIRKTEPRVSMYHLDAFLWAYEGAENKMSWLMSQGIDEDTSKVIFFAFEEIAEVKLG